MSCLPLVYSFLEFICAGYLHRVPDRANNLGATNDFLIPLIIILGKDTDTGFSV